MLFRFKQRWFQMACVTLGGGVLSFIVLMSSGAHAQADSTHHQALIVGDRSMGMGTAFTGLANDGSAVYYNPAGLSFREGAAISGGFWLNAFERRQVEDGLRRSYGSFDLVSRRVPGFPAFVLSSIALGKRRPDGNRPFVIGASAFRVRTDEFVARVRGTDPAVGLTETLDVEQLDRTMYYGLTLGYRAKHFMGAGLSLFLSRRAYTHRETTFGLSGPAPFDIDQSLGVSSYAETRLKAYHLVVRLGVLKALNPRTNLGLMAQLPGIPLRVQGRLRYQRLRYDLEDAPPEGRYVFEREGGLAASSPIPFELRLGTAWHVAPRWTWTHDLSFVGPVFDRRVIAKISTRSDAQQLGLFVDPSTERRPVVNVATGLEAELGSLVLLHLGAFTDFSSARPIPERSEVYQSARVHLFGFAASIAIRSNERGLALGLAGTLGRGTALAAVVEEDVPGATYVRTRMKTRSIFVSLTGAVETAQQLVRDAADRVAPDIVD